MSQIKTYPAAMPEIEDPYFYIELGKFLSNIKGIKEITDMNEIMEIFPEIKEIPAGEEVPNHIFDVDFLYNENSESISYIIENYEDIEEEVNDIIDNLINYEDEVE